ncbi:MAG: EAL domain-containing protein [Lachnospiraceae bacterium]|nr:EAL domain-containing protein [Lachnospiraceae bacterium]
MIVVKDGEIKQKNLSLQMGLNTLIAAIIGIIAISILSYNTYQLSVRHNHIMDDNYARLNYMNSISSKLYEHEALVFRHMATEDEEDRARLQRRAEVIEDEIDWLLKSFSETLNSGDYETYYHSINSGLRSYFSNVDMIFDLSNKGDVKTAVYYMQSSISASVQKINDYMTSYNTRANLEMLEAKTDMQKAIISARRVAAASLVMLSFFTIISLILCLRISNRMMNRDHMTETLNFTKLSQYADKLKRKDKLKDYVGVYANIKDFKYINQNYGSRRGDAILIAYVKVLDGAVKKGEIVSRYGGDSFVALILRERINEFLSAIATIPMRLELSGKSADIEVITRCGLYDIGTNDDIREIINGMTLALNEARNSKTLDRVWFRPEMYDDMMAERGVIAEFDRAVKDHEFSVYYQPKVNIATRELSGCEALVRWIRDGKVVPPDDFIPILEQEGRVTQLDFYVFEQVCRDIKDWERQGLTPVRVSSNFSKLHLRNPRFAAEVLNLIEIYKVDPDYIEIELTESSGYENFRALSGFVENMRLAGIQTSMDDFGTGYSSLSLLKDLDVDVVKLDKTFLQGIEEGSKTDEKMVENVVHMIKDLDRKVICEGVETVEQAEFLKSVDCVMAQGYLYDKPLPKEEFEKRMLHPIYELKRA